MESRATFKNNIMNPKIFSLFLILIFASCITPESNEKQISKASLEALKTIEKLPKLLDRNEAIYNGNEWSNVQNNYGGFRQQIIENKKPSEAKLKMAQLFTLEARITGEHGHYYPAALQLLNEILKGEKLDKDLNFRTLSLKSSVLLSQHEFQKALKIAQKAVELNPYNAQIYGILTDAYLELGDYEKAVASADKMVSIRPDLRSYSRVSYLREIYGMKTEAIEAMEMAVEAGFPGYEETAWAGLQLGQLYQKIGQMDKAKTQYLQILNERPNYPFATAALAEIEIEKQNYPEAEKLLKEACRVIPEVGFYEQLAHLYFKTGETEKAEKLIPEILAMLKDDIESGHNMNMEYAAVYRDLVKDFDKALEYALAEYELRPKNRDVNELIKSIYLEKGDSDLAGKYELASL